MPTTEELAPETDEADGSEDESSDSGNAGGGASGGSRGPSARRESRTKADLTDRATEQAAKLAGPEAAAAVKTVNKLERKSKTLRAIIRIGRAVGALGPVGTTILVVGIFVFLVIVIVLAATSGGAGVNQQEQTGPKLTLTKTGPTEAKAGEILRYQIAVAYPATAQDITITDRIPDGTEFDPSNPPSAHYDPATRTVTWNFKEFYPPDASGNITNINSTLTLNLKATADNSFLVNRAEGTVTPYVPPEGVNGDMGKFLPNPIPPDPEGVESSKNTALNAINQHKAVYQAASAATGVPWQVFAGIHYREGSAAANTSLVSGRPIGGNEPDVVAGPGCSNDAPRGVDDGIPEPMAGGCGFASMLDSGIYGGNLLKGKVGGNLNTFEDLIKALSRYNGGGNANCGKGVPYNGCPRLFEGEDDPYALNFFDAKHKPMYVIYCADYTKCNPPLEDHRPGTGTVAKWAAQQP